MDRRLEIFAHRGIARDVVQFLRHLPDVLARLGDVQQRQAKIRGRRAAVGDVCRHLAHRLRRRGKVRQDRAHLLHHRVHIALVLQRDAPKHGREIADVRRDLAHIFRRAENGLFHARIAEDVVQRTEKIVHVGHRLAHVLQHGIDARLIRADDEVAVLQVIRTLRSRR